MAYFFLVLAFIFNGTANVLLKIGAEKGLVRDSSIYVFFAQNWQILCGLLLFAVNVIFYFLALRSLPLSVAYPVMVAMSFLIVNGYSSLYLHEPITLFQYVGYVLIVIGLSLVVSRIA